MKDLIGLLGVVILIAVFVFIRHDRKKNKEKNFDDKNQKIYNNDSQHMKTKTPFYKKLFLMTVISLIVVNVSYSLNGGKGISSITFPILFGGLFWTIIAYFSFKGSKAASSEIKKEISKTMDTKPDTSKSLKEVVHDKIQDNKEKKEKIVLKEDEIYDQIGKEIEEDKKIRSVWTKALAQADGDVNKAESQYIKLRFDILNKELLNK